MAYDAKDGKQFLELAAYAGGSQGSLDAATVQHLNDVLASGDNIAIAQTAATIADRLGNPDQAAQFAQAATYMAGGMEATTAYSQAGSMNPNFLQDPGTGQNVGSLTPPPPPAPGAPAPTSTTPPPANTPPPAPSTTGQTGSAGSNPGSTTSQTGDANAAAAAAQQANEQSAIDIVNTFLNQLGLSSLSGWAWQQITQGASAAQVEVQLYQQPAFQQRFPGIFAMQKAGLAPPSPGEYLNVENAYKQQQVAAGYTPSNNPNDYVNLFTNQVSPTEFQQRLQVLTTINKVYGPLIRQQFEQYAGITTNVDDANLYKMVAGLDPTLIQQYSAATGTPETKLSFADITESARIAQSAYQQEFHAQGGTQTGPPGLEQGAIEERLTQLPSTGARPVTPTSGTTPPPATAPTI